MDSQSIFLGYTQGKERVTNLWTNAWDNAKPHLQALGKSADELFPNLTKVFDSSLPNRNLFIGSVIAAGALLGGGSLVHRLSKQRHQGRSKRGMWHGTDAGAFVGLGAGILTLAKTKNPVSAGFAMTAGIFAGNFLYDKSYRHGDTKTNATKNALVALTALTVYQESQKHVVPLGIQALSTQLARTKTGEEWLKQLRRVPGVSKLLVTPGFSMALAAASVPLTHSIITRAFSEHSRRRSLDASNAVLPSMMENQAGAQGGQTYTGVIMDTAIPSADVYASGSLTTHYDKNRVRQNLI